MSNQLHSTWQPAVEDFEDLSRASVMEYAPDSDLDAMAVVMNLLRAANRLQQDFETSVHRPAGLSFTAFRVMFAIRAVEHANPLQLANLSHVSPASISSVLNTLERYGLIVRTKEPSGDGRMIAVELTPEGEHVLTTLWKSNHQREIDWAGALTARERRTASRLLRKLIAFRPTLTAETPARLVRHWPATPPNRVQGSADLRLGEQPVETPPGSVHAPSRGHTSTGGRTPGARTRRKSAHIEARSQEARRRQDSDAQ
jgi:MarR family transcriptional regulator, negative regulator of the multidrug operon emrRAB